MNSGRLIRKALQKGKSGIAFSGGKDSTMNWGDDGPKTAMRYFTRLLPPNWTLGGLQPAYILYRGFLTLLTKPFRKQPTLITERKWDHLILLDACRYDMFCSVLGKSVPHIYSAGTWTRAWTKANLVNNSKLQDVTLITASGYTTPQYFETQGWKFPFAECVNVFLDDWDNYLNSVRPEKVVMRCLAVLKDSTRTLTHFLQPHTPWIPYIDAHPVLEESLEPKTFSKQQRLQMEFPTQWDLVRKREFPIPTAKIAYEDNLRYVLQSVWKLVQELDGVVVITSDHGNLFGEYGLFGHPPRVYVPELTKVPWLELEGGRNYAQT